MLSGERGAPTHSDRKIALRSVAGRQELAWPTDRRGRRIGVGSDFLVGVSGEETLTKGLCRGSLTPMVLLIQLGGEVKAKLG
jgi:hypothetical protein